MCKSLKLQISIINYQFDDIHYIFMIIISVSSPCVIGKCPQVPVDHGCVTTKKKTRSRCQVDLSQPYHWEAGTVPLRRQKAPLFPCPHPPHSVGWHLALRTSLPSKLPSCDKSPCAAVWTAGVCLGLWGFVLWTAGVCFGRCWFVLWTLGVCSVILAGSSK